MFALKIFVAKNEHFQFQYSRMTELKVFAVRRHQHQTVPNAVANLVQSTSK